MMKLVVFFLLAIVALASAGLLGEGPEVYSAVTTQQVHGPWSSSSSSRVQTFNDYTVVSPVVAPVVAAPVYSAPIAYAAKAYGYHY